MQHACTSACLLKSTGSKANSVLTGCRSGEGRKRLERPAVGDSVVNRMCVLLNLHLCPDASASRNVAQALQHACLRQVGLRGSCSSPGSRRRGQRHCFDPYDARGSGAVRRPPSLARSSAHRPMRRPSALARASAVTLAPRGPAVHVLYERLCGF